MALLTDYKQFAGRHWETGSVQNYYAYRGVIAPHTGKPLSEALLLGVSGGITFGYFAFAYAGVDPMVAILTRNTFDPWERMLSRLGVVQNILQTASAEKGRRNLYNTLAEGTPAIVWADYFTLPYNQVEPSEGMWAMLPLLVYGLDQGVGHIADRSGVGLVVSAETLHTARARVKNNKFRLITLEAPDFNKLSSAVSAGIWDTIKIFSEKPPKGSAKNFGFAGYKNWVNLLTKPNAKKSWARVFPRGPELLAGLLSSYERVTTFGQAGCGAERQQYADFLDEASLILARPALQDVATIFRQSAAAWCKLGETLLPDAVAPLGETRRLIEKRSRLFYEQGQADEVEIVDYVARLAQLKGVISAEFPLSANDIPAFQHSIATQIIHIHDIELQAITALKKCM